MKTSTRRGLVFGFSALSIVVAVACSDSADGSAANDGDAGGGNISSPPSSPSEGGASPDSSTPPPPLQPQAVTFSYRPSWKGVKTVEVFGGFGQATDWKQPLITLTDNGSGTFTGTSPPLANGHYFYLFHTIGDEAAAPSKAGKLARYAIDPTNPAFAACPEASPTFSEDVANPCSDLTVPKPAAAPPIFHVRGLVQFNGAPIAGYHVEIERQEPKAHHAFADRTTTGADGKFDLSVASGSYRFQVLHPTYLSMADAERTNPDALGAARRMISSATVIDAERMLNAAEVSYSYAAMQPRGSTSLPTTFTFGVPDGGTKVRAAVYGPGNSIGDPWWVGPYGKATSDEFDGGFNTKKAVGAGPKSDAGYSWGTEQQYPTPKSAEAVTWTAQSMVLPVRWP